MKLDAIELRAIPFIPEGDHCYYYLNRINGGYSVSSANDRINNFKKSLERFSDRPDVLRYKYREIDKFAQDLSELFTEQLSEMTNRYDVVLVPMNTSRPRNDPYFDDRLIQLCEKTACKIGNLGIANVMNSRSHIRASHENGPRDYETLKNNLEFLGFDGCVPDVAILVDDVLTTGTHYAVCRDAILSSYPNTLVMGAFLSIQRSDHVDYRKYGIEYQA